MEDVEIGALADFWEMKRQLERVEWTKLTPVWVEMKAQNKNG